MAKLEIPILIMNGSTDLQVDMEQAATLAKSNKRARLVAIRGMNHVLKTVSGNLQEQLPSYGDPNLAISAELVEEITSFIKSDDSAQGNKSML